MELGLLMAVTAMWVLEIEPRSPARASSQNHRTISLIPKQTLFYTLQNPEIDAKSLESSLGPWALGDIKG